MAEVGTDGGQILAMDDNAFLRLALISGVIASSAESEKGKWPLYVDIIFVVHLTSRPRVVARGRSFLVNFAPQRGRGSGYLSLLHGDLLVIDVPLLLGVQ